MENQRRPAADETLVAPLAPIHAQGILQAVPVGANAHHSQHDNSEAEEDSCEVHLASGHLVPLPASLRRLPVVGEHESRRVLCGPSHCGTGKMFVAPPLVY